MSTLRETLKGDGQALPGRGLLTPPSCHQQMGHPCYHLTSRRGLRPLSVKYYQTNAGSFLVFAPEKLRNYSPSGERASAHRSAPGPPGPAILPNRADLPRLSFSLLECDLNLLTSGLTLSLITRSRRFQSPAGGLLRGLAALQVILHCCVPEALSPGVATLTACRFFC